MPARGSFHREFPKYPPMILSRRFLPVVLSFAAGSLAYADVKLPAILSDHMVLQAGKPASIWGWADPQEKVTVKLKVNLKLKKKLKKRVKAKEKQIKKQKAKKIKNAVRLS